MSRFVLDCSIAMGWCFEDESSGYAVDVLRSLTESEAVTPDIWPLEVVNVLLVGERRKRLTQAESARFLSLLLELPISVQHETPERMFNEVTGLARNLGLSSYDASYLALAVHLDLPLATSDEKLAAAASNLGLALFDPS